MDAVLKNLRPDSVALDIGAHIGTITRLLASRFPDGHVHAFEPSPDTYRQLCRNCSGFLGISCHQLALGRNGGEEYFSSDDATISVLRHIVPKGPSTVRVRASRLSDWLTENNVTRLDLIKIDVEGFEEDVLVPAKEVLNQLRPTIIFEYYPPFAQDRSFYRGEQLFPLLRSLKYTVYRLDHTGGLHADFQEDITNFTNDYVAIPKR